MKALLCTLILAAGGAALVAHEAQDPTIQQSAPSGFGWLDHFEGTWNTAYGGGMRSRKLADKWIVLEYEIAGIQAVQTLGYDDAKDMYVGTWIDTTSSHIWHYTGTIDKKAKELILDAVGPDMADPSKTRNYRDRYTFKSADEIVAVSEMQGDDGSWTEFQRSSMTKREAD